MSRGDPSGCLSKQGVTVGSMGASGEPRQRVDASGTLNVRYSHQIRSLRTKLRVRVGSMDAPKKAKKRYAHQVCSLHTKTRGHSWIKGCAQDAPKGIWRLPRDPSDPRKAKRKNCERRKTITAKAPQSEAQKQGGVGSSVGRGLDECWTSVGSTCSGGGGEDVY